MLALLKSAREGLGEHYFSLLILCWLTCFIWSSSFLAQLFPNLEGYILRVIFDASNVQSLLSMMGGVLATILAIFFSISIIVVQHAGSSYTASILAGYKSDFSLKTVYKLLLNGLYGKTYQTIRQTSYEETSEWTWNHETETCFRNEIEYRAGGIYLPHIGAWITSLCRARLHQLLHQYEAIDCATDSFKTTRRAKEGKGLGELKLESEGLLLLVRAKLYVMFSNEVQREVFKEYNRDLREFLKHNLEKLDFQKDVVKYASHGF